ncbi:MAG: hypothetical protein A3G41_05760 [Elusimicrobia bacterium RIFCSPLOWO2_12_FULL_59_9]|nr:MAG: hypothetical protein A3G41_05760 [Elusimicrobia bacterium RIFCSPLOWO2_12_FULL_59_9]
MRHEIDSAKKEVSFRVSPLLYSMDSLEVAANVFSKQAEIFLEEGGRSWTVTLRSKKKEIAAGTLENLAGDFLNELLNQEYRKMVGGFNRKISDLILMQALYSAKSEPTIMPPLDDFSVGAHKKEMDELMKRTQKEIERFRPAKGAHVVK